MGIAWYRESDWPRVKTLFADADQLHDTHAEWLSSVLSFERHLAESGVAIERFAMDLDDFIGWCSARGTSPDAEARSTYIAARSATSADAPRS